MEKAEKRWPETVDEAVDWLMSDISAKDKRVIRKMKKDSLIDLRMDLGLFISNFYGLWSGNKKLLSSCHQIKGPHRRIGPEKASMTIIETLWERLQIMVY